MTIDIGLKNIIKDNDTLVGNNPNDNQNNYQENNQNSFSFEKLHSLYLKNCFEEIKKIVNDVLSKEDKDSPPWMQAKCWDMLVSLEEKNIPSFLLLAPFGELCEKIKLNRNKKDVSLDEILKVGNILYDKFLEILSSSNEEGLLKTLNEYQGIFCNTPPQKKEDEFSITHSKRGEDYISEITLSKQFTNNKLRKRLVYVSLLLIIVFGIIVIYVNESFKFQKAIRNPDALSVIDIEYEPKFFKKDFFTVEKSLDIDDPIKEDLNFGELSVLTEKAIGNVKKGQNKKKFKLGIYTILKDTKVMMNPEIDANILGTLSVNDKIKIVGFTKDYYQIASKDGSVFGYIEKNSVKINKGK